MKSTKDTNFFKNLFNDPEFFDIIATVHNQTDDTHVQYYMHQMIVCNSSAHFKQLCSSAPADGNGYRLLSFNTTPGAFELISPGMEDFRLALLQYFLSSKAKSCYSINGQYEGYTGQWQLFKEISELGLPRDRDTLSRFVKYYIPGVTPPSAWLQKLSSESKNGLMAAILLDKKGNTSGENFGTFPYGNGGNYKNFNESIFFSHTADSRLKNAMRHRPSGCWQIFYEIFKVINRIVISTK
ncbi:hypothetical protein TWF192_004229 [Orbilia oligospora]|uniref:BTB domain-containing protein n=1 Tax=Orbilia oligospora TaxID=2813651 RepID=A0A6G1ME51_ORBOL|nr:hypothetical protein TWF191_002405 [Orbilia oligospora]KAF3252944.1 hypothetical protein TWF192_004229 [Orbilia oligospora]